MLRAERFLILNWIKIKENFVRIAKTMLHKHHKTERKMTAQFLAQLLQRLQNTDVRLYSTTQSLASRRESSLESRMGFLAHFSLHQTCGSLDLWGTAPEPLNRYLEKADTVMAPTDDKGIKMHVWHFYFLLHFSGEFHVILKSRH